MRPVHHLLNGEVDDAELWSEDMGGSSPVKWVACWLVLTIAFAWSTAGLLSEWLGGEGSSSGDFLNHGIIVAAASFLFALSLLYIHDRTQTDQPIQRMFPVLYWGRKASVTVGPLLRQYWFTNDLEEKPFNRVTRDWVYKTSRGESNNIGFGSQVDFDAVGTYHVLPALFKKDVDSEDAKKHKDGFSLTIGDREGVDHPVTMDHFVNISAMSFGSLSARAIESLNRGAKDARILHNTGEGGLSPYHKSGGDVIFQMGTAKFGVRNDDSTLNDALLKELASYEKVRMIEIKLSQGAKPGKGGMLLKEKITSEISSIRKVPMGKDVLSPPRHPEIDDVPSLFDFIDRVREITKKPVGIKIVVGHMGEIEAIAEAMAAEPGRGPDYISVDGSEGGTGAAPLVLASHAGLPMKQSIAIVDYALRKHGVRDSVAVLSCGQIATPIDIVVAMALGADAVYIARGFMLALGCIQALDCHSNHCPTGIATQSKRRQKVLDIPAAASRVSMYAQALQKEVMLLTKSCGYTSPQQFTADDIMVVTSPGHLDYLSELHGVSAVEASIERTAAQKAGMTVGEMKMST